MPSNENYKLWAREFSKRLRAALDAKKMRAADLAEMTGIGKSDISNYLAGKYLPRQDKTALLASALEVDPVWLIALDTRMPVISNEPWDPDKMGQEEDESITIVNRIMRSSNKEMNRRLKDMILLWMQEDFNPDGTRKK